MMLNKTLLNPKSQVGADIKTWLAEFGGKGLEKATKLTKNELITIIKHADLRGLGGSGFPTYRKWEIVAEQEAEDKYLICNGNEDEPGTFKDRHLLEHTPHQVIEGAVITALATGCNNIIIYINPEMVFATASIDKAIKQWYESNLLPKNITIQLLASSGHYIGGEETAAISTVEGGFPFPRGKPPYPAISGVENKPTLINNIETLSHVSHIIRNGAKWFKNQGEGNSAGSKLYSLSGDILNPGLYELPMGITLNELINNHGGGMLQDKILKAVFTGGPSNTILTKNDLDVSLDFESVKERDSHLGTGAMIVISEGTGIVKRVANYVNFFAHSSCGQCPPCKSGTYYMAMLLNKMDGGQSSAADLLELENLCKILPDSGLCHLPNGAVKVVESSLRHFRGEFQSTLNN